MNSTIIVLNYNTYGRISDLSRQMISMGKHVTLISNTSFVPQDSYSKLIVCDNVFDYEEVRELVRLVSDDMQIANIVNNISFRFNFGNTELFNLYNLLGFSSIHLYLSSSSFSLKSNKSSLSGDKYILSVILFCIIGL